MAKNNNVKKTISTKPIIFTGFDNLTIKIT